MDCIQDNKILVPAIMVLFLLPIFTFEIVWFARSLALYIRNGFDFSQEVPPKIWWGEGPEDVNDPGYAKPMSPKAKFLFGLPFGIILAGILCFAAIFELIDVLENRCSLLS